MHIEWKKDLELGIEAIDNDHRHLLGLLNRVGEASQRDDRETALAVIHALKHYTRGHFAREEWVMRAIGYEHAQQHREEHRQLIEDVERHSTDLLAGRIIAGAVSIFLQRWLLRHIAISDRQLGKAVAAWQCQHGALEIPASPSESDAAAA